jgi:hypothetical protein
MRDAAAIVERDARPHFPVAFPRPRSLALRPREAPATLFGMAPTATRRRPTQEARETTRE